MKTLSFPCCKSRWLRLFFVFSCLMALGANLPAHASGTTQFKHFLAGTTAARANFTQTVTARAGRKPQVSQGTLAFSRPGRFRWVYEKPYPQLLVGDGERLWSHDPELNQVTVKKLGAALGASPAALLAGDNALDKNFVITDAGEADGLEFIEAMPRNNDSAFQLVRIGLSNNLPRRMVVHDHFGQITTLEFSRFERNPSLPGELFRFTPPPGADVVGE